MFPISTNHSYRIHLLAGLYACPLYYYPMRSGFMGRPSFVMYIDFKSGVQSIEHWIRRAAGALLSTEI